MCNKTDPSLYYLHERNSHKTLRSPLQMEVAKIGKSDAVSLQEMEVDNARIKIYKIGLGYTHKAPRGP